MPFENTLQHVSQFAAAVRGVPVQQTGPLEIPALDVATLRATPFKVLDSARVKAGFVVVPFRAVLHKPSGDAYAVPNGTSLKVRWIGSTTQLLHLELDPLQLGVGKGLDQAAEFSMVVSGPSFDFTGASQAIIALNPDVDAEGKGLEIYNSGSAEITSVGVPLYLWVWYTTLPIRQTVR